MALFANPLKPKRPPEVLPPITRRELKYLLEAQGWALWNNTQPYLEYGASRDDAGAMLVGKLDGDLSWVPRDSVASTASRLHMAVVLLTCQTPKVAVNEYMIGRNCYLLRYDELPMLPSVLALLKLELARQQEQMKVSAQPVAYASKEGDLTYSSDDVVQQLFRAVLGRAGPACAPTPPSSRSAPPGSARPRARPRPSPPKSPHRDGAGPARSRRRRLGQAGAIPSRRHAAADAHSHSHPDARARPRARRGGPRGPPPR